MEELDWIGSSWIDYVRQTHRVYYRVLKKERKLFEEALKKQQEYYRILSQLKIENFPPRGAEEIASDILYS